MLSSPLHSGSGFTRRGGWPTAIPAMPAAGEPPVAQVVQMSARRRWHGKQRIRLARRRGTDRPAGHGALVQFVMAWQIG